MRHGAACRPPAPGKVSLDPLSGRARPLRGCRFPECDGHIRECAARLRECAGRIPLSEIRIPECDSRIRLSDFRTPECAGHLRLSDFRIRVSDFWIPESEIHSRECDFRIPSSDKYSSMRRIRLPGNKKPGEWNDPFAGAGVPEGKAGPPPGWSPPGAIPWRTGWAGGNESRLGPWRTSAVCQPPCALGACGSPAPRRRFLAQRAPSSLRAVFRLSSLPETLSRA